MTSSSQPGKVPRIPRASPPPSPGVGASQEREDGRGPSASHGPVAPGPLPRPPRAAPSPAPPPATAPQSVPRIERKRERRTGPLSSRLRAGLARPFAKRRRASVPADVLQDERREARSRMIWLGAVLTLATIVSPLIAVVSPSHPYVIASGSMEPALPIGSLVVVVSGTPAVGDIVLYESPVAGPQVHRVVEIREENGKTIYTTQGDANPAEDSFTVPSDQVVGVVKFHVPYVGYLWLMPVHFQVGLFALFLVAYLGITSWDARRVMFRARHAYLTVTMAFLMYLPSAFAGVSLTWPTSTHTVNVATPPTPLSSGTMGTATITDEVTATTTTPPPKLWKEIVLWNCYGNGDSPTDDCDPCINATPYTVIAGSIFQLDVSQYDPAPSFYLQADFTAPNGETAYVSLYDEDAASTVSGTEVSTTSTTRTLSMSGAFSLSGDSDYQFQMKNSGGTCAGTIYQVRLLSAQEYPTKTVTQVRMGSGSTSTLTAFNEIKRTVRWLYETTSLDGVSAIYFEVVGKVGGGQLLDSTIRLIDTTTGLSVSSHAFASTDTSITLKRSGDIKASLTDGRVYYVDVAAGTVAKAVYVYSAKLVIVQSSFTKTISYVDISTRTTTSSASYVEKGWYGQYMINTEWDTKKVYFEGTLHDDGVTDTAYARLYDKTADAAVTDGEISVTGSTRTRVRSADLALTINAANATYVVQVKATVDMTLSHAVLVIHLTDVAGGHTDDHLFKATNNVGTPTWEYWFAPSSSSNLAKMTKALVGDRLGSDATTTMAGALDGAKYASSAVWTGTYAFVFGGSAAGTVILRYDPVTDTTTPMNAAFSATLKDSRAVWSGTYAYILGGTLGGSKTDKIWQYDPGADQLTELGVTLPSARDAGAAVWTGTYIFYLGGQDSGSNKLDKIVRVDPVGLTKQDMAAVLDEATQWPTAVYDSNRDRIFVFGGSDACCKSSRIERYDPTGDSITTLAARLPVANHHHVAVWDGSSAYLLGGKNEANAYLDDIVRFDTEWETVELLRTSLPAVRGRFPAVWTPYGIFAFGGRNEAVTPDATDDIVKYTARTGQIRYDSTASTVLPTARSGTSAVWTGSYVFVFGGNDAGGNLNTIVRYDPNTNRVKAMTATLPSARQYTSAVWTGTYAYIFGGTGANVYSDILRYDPATDTLTNITASSALPSTRHATSAVWTGTYAFIFGGYTGSSYLSEVVRFNPATGAVTTMSATLPTTRRWTSAVWTGTYAYVFGGTNGGSNFNTIVRYDASGDSVTTMAATLPSNTYASSASWDGTYAYIYGGYDGSSYLDRIARYDPAADSVATLVPVLPATRRYTSAVGVDGLAFVLGGHNGAYNDDIVRFSPSASTVTDVVSQPQYTYVKQRVATAGTLQVTALNDPASSGTATIVSDLKADVVGYGIHTIQPITFQFK